MAGPYVKVPDLIAASGALLARKPIARKVMASPPTPTYTTAATIASPRTIRPANGNGLRNGSQFTYSRAGGLSFGATNPNTYTVGFTSVDYGASQTANASMVSFYHTGRYLEIATKSVNQKMLLRVNDEYVSLTPQAADNSGSTYFWYYDFGSISRRRIDFLSSGGGCFQGVLVSGADGVEAAELRGPRTIIVGDSFTEGSGADAGAASGLAAVFADAMGWDDVWPSGVGSTGWLNAGSYQTIGARLDTDVIPFAPKVVIFTAGCNDNGAVYADMYAEVRLRLQQLRAALPGVIIANFGPFWRSSPGYTTPLALYAGAMKGIHDAFVAEGCLSVPMIEMPLPADFVQPSLTVLSNASAGATQFQMSAQGPGEMTYAFPDGSRAYAESVAGGSFIAQVDGTLQTALTAGQAITVVGNSLWTGGGKVGTTTGYGNSDVLVSSDGTHPSQLGHDVIGARIAELLIPALAA